MSSSNRPAKRPRVKARSARRPATIATRRATPQLKPAPASRPAAKRVQRTGAAAEPAAKPTGPGAPPSFRVSGSSKSRLTIKPGQPQTPRAPLELSKKARPSGPRPLSQVVLDEDEVLMEAFDATLYGVRVRITAVLERTCVYVDKDGDRRLARKNDLWVEADRLPIRRRSISD
ncbi:MAG: hypothetical protein ACYDB4_10390 [Candidatus Dormibacteraceae bacterium]